MTQGRQEPSAVIWRWRGGESAEQARAREAAAARRRGASGAAIGLAMAAAVYFLAHRPVAAAVIAVIAIAFALIALLSPRTLWPRATRTLDRFAHLVGIGVTWVLMTLMYYLLFLPVGLVLRARKRLGITRSFDPGMSSYWIEARPRTPDSYRRQF